MLALMEKPTATCSRPGKRVRPKRSTASRSPVEPLL
jgi:hypothetical protein